MVCRLNIKKFTEHYVKVYHKVLRDKALSLKAKGLHAYMQSMPDRWEFSIRSLSANLREGTKAVQSTLNELIRNGYLERSKCRDEKRQYIYFNYYVYPVKKPDYEKILRGESD
jgi:DNA-binding MarR family transcriptional regulator